MCAVGPSRRFRTVRLPLGEWPGVPCTWIPLRSLLFGDFGVDLYVCLFSFFFLRRRKTKVSDREFDPRWLHSACKSDSIAHGEIAVPVMK